MAIPQVTAPLPSEYSDPWIAARDLFDEQLKATANGAATAADAAAAALPTKADSSALTNGLAGKISTTEKAAANGVATLGPDGKLLDAQLPAIAITEYLGSVANQAAMLAKTGQSGDWVLRQDLGTVWIITGTTPSQLSSWTELGYPTAPVSSVNGQTGVVVISPSSIGAATAGDLDNVFTVAQDAQSDATQALADAAAAQTTANGRATVASVAAAQAKADAAAPAARMVAGHALTADVPRAALGVVGVLEGVFIVNGGTAPAGTPAGTLVIEQGPA